MWTDLNIRTHSWLEEQEQTGVSGQSMQPSEARGRRAAMCMTEKEERAWRVGLAERTVTGPAKSRRCS